MKKNKKGFTIVELVIVIAVIAILAGVLIPTFAVVIDNARKSAAYSNCRNAMTTVISDSENGEVTDGTIFISGDYYAVFKDHKLEDVQKFAWATDNTTANVTVGGSTVAVTKSTDANADKYTADGYEKYTASTEAEKELTALEVFILVPKTSSQG